MDVKDWLKVLSLVAGVVLVGLGVTVGGAYGAYLVPTGVGLITAVGVKSEGVGAVIKKAGNSLRPPPKE